MHKGERIVESQRQKLSQLPEFEPHAAFQRIDRNSDGYISSVEMLQYLRDNEVEDASEQDCYLVIKYFNNS